MRYCPERDFPPYAFLPGRHPHPTRDPHGHSHGLEEGAADYLPPERWRENADYLWGVDLYNHGYLWEAHEAWEGLWHTAKHDELQASLLQGLIQCAAACLKIPMKQPRGLERLCALGTEKLERVARGSDLVNNEVPGWGRTLSDNELHAEMMQDTFVGGSETTTNAMSAGIMLLDKNPDIWEQLKSDPDKYLNTFVEEVVRLESPVQGLTRLAKNDVEINGVTIPEGAVVDIRYGAGNRDQRQFECPHEIKLDRKNAATHLGFSTGTHYCLGATLARRELYWGFKAFIDRIESFRVVPEKNNLRHLPNYSLRILKELHIEFTPK